MITMEQKIITTLIKMIQKNVALSEEEKSKRIIMLFDWWRNYGNQLTKINKKISRNFQTVNRKLVLFFKHHRLFHKLRLAYEGIDGPSLGDEPKGIKLDISKIIDENYLFIDTIKAEISENHKIFST